MTKLRSFAECPKFIPWDIEVARFNFGANCGPAAFATATQREVCRVMRYFSHFEHSCWTNLTQMRKAFAGAGYDTEVIKRDLPRKGVALVQWLGPWTAPDFFSRWSLIHTHWVAVQDDWIFDHTVGEWQAITQWESETAREFIAEIPSAYGWAIKYGLEVSNENSGCLESSVETSFRSQYSEFSLSR